MISLRVVDAGPLTTVQDLGRTGLAHLAVGRSGACDAPALRLANRIVGNVEGAAALELTLGGLVVEFSGPVWFALTGAPARTTLDGRAVSCFAPVFAAPHSRLAVGVPPAGLRTYLAVRGGVDVAPVLGSCSTDLLTGIGPAPLAAGDELPIGARVAGPVASLDIVPSAPIAADPVLAVQPGPRAASFAADALPALAAGRWQVSPDSNRIAVRLVGVPITGITGDELPSEGLVLGAVQVPPSGLPVIFLADHPVTGGYPVLAVLHADAVAAAAQLRPGQPVRFAQRR